MSQLAGASYRVRFPSPFLTGAGVDPDALVETLAERIRGLMARDRLIVRRQGEDRTREFDAKPSIVSLRAGLEEAPGVLDASIRFLARAQARPDELVGLMFPEADPRSLDTERVELWAEVGGRRLDPLALLNPGD
jgi:hypothetical protein